MDCGVGIWCVWEPGSETISPGAGNEGSLSWRFISTADRRRPVCGDCRWREREPLDVPTSQSTLVRRFSAMIQQSREQRIIHTSAGLVLQTCIHGGSSLK